MTTVTTPHTSLHSLSSFVVGSGDARLPVSLRRSMVARGSTLPLGSPDSRRPRG